MKKEGNLQTPWNRFMKPNLITKWKKALKNPN